MKSRYDKKALMKYLLGLVAVMLAMKFTQGIGFLFVIPFVLLAFFSRKNTSLFFYLMLTVAMVVGNAWLMPKGVIFSYAQRGLLMLMGSCMMLMLAGSANHRLFKPLLMLIPYLFAMLVSSFYGWSPLISYLKLILFTTVFFAYFGVCNRIAQDRFLELAQVRSVVLAFSCFFILGSIVLIPFPAISQLSGEEYVEAMKRGGALSLFKGMTMHSQCLGPCVAVIFAVLFADFVFSIRKPDKLYLLLLFCSPILIYKTSSRTAMGSLMVAVAVTMWLSLKNRGIGIRWRSKVMGFVLAFTVLGCGAVLAVPSARSAALSYALKFQSVGASESVTVDEVVASRQGKWEEGIANFKRSPVIGNGFQVSEEMRGTSGLFLTAPVEKSVWISAVLEEGGFVGFLLFCVFVIGSYVTFVRRKAYIGAVSFFVMVTTNLGEFTIFSLSYTGGLLWAMVFAGLVLDAGRLKEEGKQEMLFWR